MLGVHDWICKVALSCKVIMTIVLGRKKMMQLMAWIRYNRIKQFETPINSNITVKGLNPGVISEGWVWSSGWTCDSDWRFDNLCGSHLQSQSELYHVSWWYYTLVIDLIGQLCCDVIGCLSVKPWCYWLWRLVISDWCDSIRLLSQLNSRLLLVKLSVLQLFSHS